MSHLRTGIRRMFAYGPKVVSPLECLIVYRMARTAPREEAKVLLSQRGNATVYRSKPVLIVPYNPAVRLAMIRRTVRTLWPRAKGVAREKREAQVLFILGTALTPM